MSSVKEHKLRFSASVAVKWSGRGMVSVPALPYRGQWVVVRLGEYNTSVTCVSNGEKACDIKNLRKGRLICAVLNALPEYWQDWPKHAHEFRESLWWEWLQDVR